MAASDPLHEADRLFAAGEFEASLEVLNAALKDLPDPAEALLQIGAIHLQLGRFREAERAYARALSALPEGGAADALIRLGAVYLKTGELAKAERRAFQVVQM